MELKLVTTDNKIKTMDMEKFLENVKKELEGIALKTPAVIIIGEVVNHHQRLQKYVTSIPADYVDPVGDFGFDIWKNEVVVA